MATRRLGIVMYGVTGRMGLNELSLNLGDVKGQAAAA